MITVEGAAEAGYDWDYEFVVDGKVTAAHSLGHRFPSIALAFAEAEAHFRQRMPGGQRDGNPAGDTAPAGNPRRKASLAPVAPPSAAAAVFGLRMT
ncbi:hypothetical protein PTE30175_02934 [Pandoraea terrae]|uniref:Uncharacterized protein n=1 Tax=Pandoraea terrae TaxID=1537710 RepID=A0A5E4W239_9BURK|nr:hypothetical protein [Pandoraea terrae]VVE18732.1 hypothetical protein PTE30175_02934 [Pandoraea terrae]